MLADRTEHPEPSETMPTPGASVRTRAVTTSEAFFTAHDDGGGRRGSGNFGERKAPCVAPSQYRIYDCDRDPREHLNSGDGIHC
jgi:hypothetical protein